MTTVEQKKNLKDFVERWRGRGYEKGETQQFWLQLLRAIGYEYPDTVLFENPLKSKGFPDVWIREVNVMIEQKSLGVDLDKPEPRQGQMKTPFKQVLDYAEDVPLNEQPSFLITCNFGTFRIYDRAKWNKSELENHPFEFTLDELEQHPEYLACITDPANSRLEKEKAVSIKAGERIGQLYDLLRQGYIDPDSEESMHALNVLCVRLVFCLYCEDADLFVKDSFLQYLKGTAPEDVRLKLKNLFRALDTDRDDRDPYDTNIKIFPYVNGGLFKEDVEIPNFTQEALDFLLEEISATIDWSQISPTIFGGIFESTLNPETRRSGGMHYTSPENIHKVIDPLFLDGLWKEFNGIRDDEDLTPIEKDAAFRVFHASICQMKFLDPACGSGNFLTETYLSLRTLENAILSNLLTETKGKKGRKEYTTGGQVEMSGFHSEEDGDRVSLAQFYGIEINDFAVAVAETALWISRLKANREALLLHNMKGKNFPLHEAAHIILGNALRMDWNDVVPADECDFIMGNPPFFGASLCSAAQKQEIVDLFGKIKLSNSLDYVSGWYYKSSEFIYNTMIRCALVSTNSITQGELVSPIWKTLIEKFNIHVDFAHRTFRWTNEAANKAHVYVVIIGFSSCVNSKPRTLYTYETVDSEPVPLKCDNINPYLLDAPSVTVESRSTPLCEVPTLVYGNKPTDDGNFILNETEKENIIKTNPETRICIRHYIGAKEFLNGGWRYCLWLTDKDRNIWERSEEILARVNRVKEFRLNSSAKPTREKANNPHQFFYISHSERPFLVVPLHSSERRLYIPIGFMSPDKIVSNAVSVVPNAEIYHFGVMTSQAHNAWMRVVAGRLESRYRYSGGVVYNNFIWPNPTDEQKTKIESCAQAVLDARDNHPGDSLATLYDPDKMPSDLLAAHKALDKAVEEAYGVDFDGDEEKIVAHLFKLYQEKVDELEAPKQKKKTPEKPKPAKPAVKVKVRKKQG